MINTNKQIEDLCNLVNNELKKDFSQLKIYNANEKNKLTFYLIGGGALMFYGAKSSTKDLDIILKSEQDYNLTKKTLE